MNDHHPTFFVAAVVAVLSAICFRLVGLPAPWPAAIALYVYGVVAWPVLREKVPSLRPTIYAAIWVSASLLVFVYENLGAYIEK